MKVQHYKEVTADNAAEATNTTVRWLIAKGDNAPNFYMRLFEVAPGGSTPHHAHDWEHEAFVIEGTGKIIGADNSYNIEPGVFAFIPGGEIHHFENTGDAALKFICLIPKT